MSQSVILFNCYHYVPHSNHPNSQLSIYLYSIMTMIDWLINQQSLWSLWLSLAFMELVLLESVNFDILD